MELWGTSFTLVQAPHPIEENGLSGRKDMHSALRVWLGPTDGTDWLHEAIREEFGREIPAYELDSERQTIAAGAGAEIAALILIFIGRAAWEFAKEFGGRTGAAAGDALADWVRHRAAEHRSERGLDDADPPPDFLTHDFADVADEMAKQLADVLDAPPDRIELLGGDRTAELAASADYRDRETGRTYRVEVGTDYARFTRTDEEITP